MRTCLGSSWIGALLLASVAAPSGARADAVSPPPDRCPSGSVAVDFCHGMPTCRAETCETDADCGAGRSCRDARLCTVDSCCSGRCCAGGCGGEPTVYTHVFGACDASDGCRDFGATCTMQKVCVAGSNADAGSGRTDAGGTSEDAGRTQDAGRSEDAGRTTDGGRRDAGRSSADAGGRRDAGGGTTAGGCCSVAGARSALGGGLFVAAVIAVLARIGRRRPPSRNP